MLRSFFISVILVMLSVLRAQAQEVWPLTRGGTTVENFVSEMFFLTHSSGSMTLHGTCEDTQQGPLVVSDPLSRPPHGPFKGLDDAMTELSHALPRLSWTRDARGLMRVSDDRVIGDILRIRLKRVHFAHATAPENAMQDIIAAPEVRSHLKQKGIEGEVFMSNIQPPGAKGLPELSGELHDVTVAQALDRVMKFFPGLWIYSECGRDSVRRVVIRGAVVAWPEVPAGAERGKQDHHIQPGRAAGR